MRRSWSSSTATSRRSVVGREQQRCLRMALLARGSRRHRSMARRRAVVTIQPVGDGGTPVRPGLESCRERHCLLGEPEVAEEAGEGRDRAAVVVAEDAPDLRGGDLGVERSVMRCLVSPGTADSTSPGRRRSPGGPVESLGLVGDVEDPEAADVLLALEVRAVDAFDLAVADPDHLRLCRRTRGLRRRPRRRRPASRRSRGRCPRRPLHLLRARVGLPALWTESRYCGMTSSVVGPAVRPLIFCTSGGAGSTKRRRSLSRIFTTPRERTAGPPPGPGRGSASRPPHASASSRSGSRDDGEASHDLLGLDERPVDHLDPLLRASTTVADDGSCRPPPKTQAPAERRSACSAPTRTMMRFEPAGSGRTEPAGQQIDSR